MTNQEIRASARKQISKDYWMILAVSFIYMLIVGSSVAIIGFLLTGPVTVGLDNYYVALASVSDQKADNLDLIVDGAKKNIKNSIITYVLECIFVFLWSLLLIVPGIMKAYSYAMVFYIRNERPDLSPTEALRKSEEMMSGNRMRMFFLHLSFLGWFILCILTAGIGFVFLFPYVKMANTAFYLDLKKRPVVIDAKSF